MDQPAYIVAPKEVIAEHLDDLLPGMEVEEHHVFRVTCNEDWGVQEEAAETAKAADVFAATRARDVLLHHPYDSFATSVQAFLE